MGPCHCHGFISRKCQCRLDKKIICIYYRLYQAEGCNVDLENKDHFTSYDYAYNSAVQEHLKGE
jgi:hypothetical protein